MKLITAMVRSDKLEAIQSVVARDAHVTDISNVADVRDTIPANYRGTSYRQPRPKLRVEIVVANDLAVEDVIAAISEVASMGDAEGLSGGIFVTPLEQWVRIPTSRPQPVADRDADGGIFRRAS
jgi:nitrogen regulatory protein PII